MPAEKQIATIDQVPKNPEAIARLAAMRAVEEAEKRLREKFPRPADKEAISAGSPAPDPRKFPDVDERGLRSPYPSKKKAEALSLEIQEAVSRSPETSETASVSNDNPVSEIVPKSEVVLPTEGALSTRRRKVPKKPAHLPVPDESASKQDAEMKTPSEEMGKKDEQPVSEMKPKKVRRRKTAKNELPQETLETYQDAVYTDWGKTQKEPYVESSAETSEENRPDAETKQPVLSPENQAIAELEKEVEELRSAYVKEDYETMSAWTKFRNIFGRNIREDEKKREYQGLYENALIRLQEKRLETIRQSGASGDELKKGFAELLKYTKLDEAIELADARTKYRAENRNFPEKVLDLLGALGRSYNRLTMKEKIVFTGLMATGAIVSTASGGFAGGALAAVFLTGKRVTGGVAMFAGIELILEERAKKRRSAEAEKAIVEQIAALPEEGNLDALQKILRTDIASLDGKLQEEKRAKFHRKSIASAAGVAAGSSSWLLNNTLAEDGIREHMQSAVETKASLGALGQMEMPNVSAEPSVVVKFQDILSSPYEVQKGDSVWKILSARAEGLEGAQKTHFIDALKDKVGDVQLKAGESFDFSQHLKPEDIQQAYADAQGLSAEKVASIAANDVKIAEYMKVNPGTALTNETVDQILQGKTETVVKGVVPDLTAQAAVEANVPLEAFGPTETASQASAVSVETAAQFKGRTEDWFMQIFRVENAGVGEDWILNKEKISGAKLMDIMRDAKLYQENALSGYKTGLNREQVKHFAEFFQGARENIGNSTVTEMLKEKPAMTVKEYLEKIAPLVKQGQRLGLYTTTQ